MARMIPSIIAPETKSSAEHKVFKWFQAASNTEDWIVLHSLGISQHISLIHGEVDFLVIAPKYGIFAIEVKGGRVKRENGMWYFTDRTGNTNSKSRGPFEQAWDGIHSIMGTSVKKRADLEHANVTNLLYGIGVMFPDIEYNSVGIDEEPWQVFDSNDDDRVREFIIRLSKGAQKKWEDTYGPLSKEKLPTLKDAKYLLSILRGDFDKAVAMRAKIRYAEQELLELTQKQYKCIDQIEENKRAVVYGPAGTGKTLIAIEQAKKSTIQGKHVALLCYNASLAKWFRDYFASAPENVRPSYIGTFHGLLIDIAEKQGTKTVIPTDNGARELFYDNELPRIVEDILLEDSVEYDELIVDEAQDLITERYLDIMDLIVSKGFERGCWKFFGDFSRQAIYRPDTTASKLFDEIEERTAFIKYKLTENCRNTKQICEEIQIVTGFDAASNLWSRIEGIPVDYRRYRDEDEELQKLEDLLNELESKSISKGDITILSPVKRENSIVSRIENVCIKNYSFQENKDITFSTIQSFKGLENAIIILVDIKTFHPEQLMYVALSRARAGLFILNSKDANNEYNKLVARRLLNG